MARTARILAAAFIALALPVVGFAQDVLVKDADLSAIISRLSDERPADRATAFYDLIAIGTLESDNHAWPVQLSVRRIIVAAPRRADELARALIALLDREDAAGASGRAGGDTYIGDLVGAVAALRDPRALTGLLRHIESGRIADRGLSALGDPAVLPVSAMTTDPNPLRRQSALIALAGMMSPDVAISVSPSNQDAIRGTLMRALADAIPSIRVEAAKGLAPLRGDDVSAALRARLSIEPDTRVVEALKAALAGR